jgi:peptidoglycan/xylan/chitin deacetylase (PgdA/CDA1 family)
MLGDRNATSRATTPPVRSVRRWRLVQPGRLMLFWDYDTQWGADRARQSGPQQWGPAEFENSEHLLELLFEYDIRCCFAVVGAAALPGKRPYHDPDQIRRIHAAGHEIASHSHKHEWLPGLNRQHLRQTLRESKDALEQCIGAAVKCFVPPFNQPYDYLRSGSISLSERREAGRERTDLYRLCEALHDTGYRTARVFYLPLHRRVLRQLLGRRIEGPSRPRQIAGITCVRLNTPCGFVGPTRAMLQRCAEEGGFVVAYGHPHSLSASGAQDKTFLVPFLRRVQELRASHNLQVVLPSSLLDRLRSA